jgi:hypothetical protein
VHPLFARGSPDDTEGAADGNAPEPSEIRLDWNAFARSDVQIARIIASVS